MPGPQVVTGLQGFVNLSPQATPDELHGGAANPAHSNLGEIAEPYPWEAYGGSWGEYQPPPGPTDGIVHDLPEYQTMGAGSSSEDPTHDYTPYQTHAAPWPKGMETSAQPEANARFLHQSRDIHASNTGAARAFQYMPTMVPQNDDWNAFYNINPGMSNLQPIPAQVAGATGGWGTRSREQSLAGQNSYGFDAAHQHRRYASGPIPGNYMWMRPGGRMFIKSMASSARPAVGKGSPFEGQNIGDSFGYAGAVLMDPATEYMPPPVPFVAPAVQATEDDSSPAIALW